jgi:peptide/nickel transport system permease protein
LTEFIIRRLLQTVLVLFILTFFVFGLLQLVPGDPVLAMLGDDADAELIAHLRHELWLDRPFIVQYGHWLGNALQGDLGDSITYQMSVVEIIAHRLPITLHLSIFAVIISTIVGISSGIIAATRRGDALDQSVCLLSNLGVAVPHFWLAILCIYLFALKLGWLPLQGYTSPFEDFWQNAQEIVMPVFLLAISSIALKARQTRSSMLEVIRQDYIRTARAKGVRERAVILKHALKNALIPIVTLIGMQFRFMIGGSVIIETVFNIPGMGRLLVNASLNKDFLVVQGGVLLMGVVVCLANLIVDISYGWLDPRIRYQ